MHFIKTDRGYVNLAYVAYVEIDEDTPEGDMCMLCGPTQQYGRADLRVVLEHIDPLRAAERRGASDTEQRFAQMFADEAEYRAARRGSDGPAPALLARHRRDTRGDCQRRVP
jgi:hypothetical protein